MSGFALPLDGLTGSFPRGRELARLGAAPVGLMPLKGADLGLSHLLGIYSWTVSEEISNAELSTQRERIQAERRSVCLFVVFFFFPLQCDGGKGEGKLGRILKINIYGKLFVFE